MTQAALLPKERLRELAALAEKATPGPWDLKPFYPSGQGESGGWSIRALSKGPSPYEADVFPCVTSVGASNLRGPIDKVENEANAAFIAACSPDTIKALLAHIALLEAENTVLLKRAKPPSPETEGE